MSEHRCVICECEEDWFDVNDKFVTFQYDIGIINAHSKCLFYMIANNSKYKKLTELLKEILDIR